MPADRKKHSAPVKVERTHQENQERAYIAASRRSDRSLEARVESARRASEIHKQRTGRGLRVTEQDVANEEMYEEEERPVTPSQYHQASAHMVTGNADFDRQLQAWMTTQLAMRSAQIHNQYRNNPQLAMQAHQMFPSPINAQYAQMQQLQNQMQSNQMHQSPQSPMFQMQQQQQMGQGMGSPTSMVSPTSRHAPYPQRRQSNFTSLEQLDTSAEDQNALPMRPAYHQRQSSSASETVFFQDPHTPSVASNSAPQRHSFSQTPTQSEGQFAQLNQPTPFSNDSSQLFGLNSAPTNNSFLNSALPLDTQMFLQGTMNPQNQIHSALMSGSERLAAHDWTTSPMQLTTRVPKHGSQQTHPSTQGLNSTLSAGADREVRDDEPPTASQEFIAQAQSGGQEYTSAVQPLYTPNNGGMNSNMTDFFDFGSFDGIPDTVEPED